VQELLQELRSPRCQNHGYACLREAYSILLVPPTNAMPSEPTPSPDSAPPDRYCDLVMKGGITSGVVYPLAILELARSYRFKNIGGTSAGAIAGVVTAAAEYRRRHGSSAGFDALRALPEQLGAPVGDRSRLLSLFQPDASTQRLFRALLAALNKPTTGQRWLGVLIGLVSAYASVAMAGAAAGALLAWLLVPRFHARTLIVMLLLAAIGALAAVVLSVYRDITHGLVPNGYGLCHGGPGAPGAPPALAPWLHELIQITAGRDPHDDPPLTFEDLWNAPGFPPPWLQGVVRSPVRSINLQVFTTNLTHGRPYHLPMDDASSRLFFKARELEKYFPAEVVQHMVKNSQPYRAVSPTDPDPSKVDAELRELPGGQLPIVVAARLSLSFPVLISALPLWAIDHDRARARGERAIRRCWFSDGGICSNFPIHLFDGFVPMWPTFGISLGSKRGAHTTTTWLPRLHEEGRDDQWNGFDDKPDAIGRLGGFVASIVSAAQNWNDATGTRMPGVRDRVVQIRLTDDQGGLNLNMPEPLIKELAGYGRDAGVALTDKFLGVDAADMQAGTARGWREHRWVRFNVLLVALRERIRALRIAADLAQHAAPLRAQIDAARAAPPLAGDGERALSAEQSDALQRLLDAVEQLESAFGAAATAQPYEPSPLPSIRVRSPL
jgi:predicted acylesterase/phospholipase RssA